MSHSSHHTSLRQSGVVVLPGGKDVDGHTLIIFPTIKLDLLNQWRVDDLASLILHLDQVNRYLVDVPKTYGSSPALHQASGQVNQLACLADLRQASALSIHHLIDCLEAVEHQKRGTIGVVYFLKPRNKTKSQGLKKLLGLKPSKKRPRIPLFKIVLLKTVQELYTQIDVSNLTPDFQGTRSYKHNAWLQLDKEVVHCIKTCEELNYRLPSVKDKVDLLSEYDTDGQTSGQLQLLLGDLTERFHVILSESSLPIVLTQTKETLLSLDHPSGGPLADVHPNLIFGLKARLKEQYSDLDKWHRELEESWKKTEQKLTVLSQVHRHRERAREIECKIVEHYQPLLREHPIVGKTLSQAELYRAHFTTTLYEPAKEVLSQATEILLAVQRLRSSHNLDFPIRRNSTPGAESDGGVATIDVSDISRCLTTSIQPFTSQLQHLQHIYVSIHIFHLLFEKTLNWYKKALKFLPDSMLQKCSMEPTSQSREYSGSQENIDRLVFMPTEWLSAVRVFMVRHPPPKEEHLERLDMNTPPMVDRRLRAQARSLALRIRLLQRVLSSTRLPWRLVSAVVTWKSELFGHQHKSPGDGTARDLPRTDELSSRQKLDVHSAKDADVEFSPYYDEGRPSAFQERGSHDYKPYQPQTLTPSSSKSSSGGTTYTGTTGVPEDTEDVINKSSQRKGNGRSNMYRAKSVEFNFNSSSTDGSVLDYDKALAGAQISHPQSEGSKLKPPISKPPRKPRRAEKAAKLGFTGVGDKLQPYVDDRVLSDQSEMTHSQIPGPRYFSAPEGNELEGSDTGDRSRLTDTPTPAPREFLGSGLRPGKGLEDLDEIIDNAAPTPSERFVRLTFTPKQSFSSAGEEERSVYEFARQDLDATGIPGHNSEVESGIETTEGNDTDDSVVKRIREISSSNISNAEKLQRVSELLSMREANLSAGLPRENLAQRFSYSTYDLRPTGAGLLRGENENLSNKRFQLTESDSKFEDEDPGQEKPADVVKKMKQNLAKSMEELNTLLSQPSSKLVENPPSMYGNSPSRSTGRRRFVSSLHIQPRYNSPDQSVRHSSDDASNETLSGRKSDVVSDEKSSRTRVRLFGGAAKTENKSDSDSNKQTLEPSTNVSRPGRYTKHKNVHAPSLSKSTNDVYQDSLNYDEENPENRSLLDASQSDIKTQRPSTLSLSSNRNFISPFFLRPATSMRDISSAGAHSMSLDFFKDPDLDADYETLQALEDIEVLQSLQSENVPSNQASQPDESPHYFDSSRQHDEEDDNKEKDTSELEPEVGEDDQKTSYGHGAEGGMFVTPTYRVEIEEPRFDRNPHLSLYKVPDDYDVARKGYDDSRDDYFSSNSSGSSDEEDATPTLLKTPSRLDRLASEAEKEHFSQEEVANTLRHIQHMLDDAETRRQRLLQQMSSMSIERDDDEDDVDGEEGEGRARDRLSQTTSVDNGYGSWASKLISVHSSSSDGAAEVDPNGGDWRNTSHSSTDSAEQQHQQHQQQHQQLRSNLSQTSRPRPGSSAQNRIFDRTESTDSY